jgi:hypothetical protein
MRFSTLVVLAGLLALAFCLGFLLVPDLVLGHYGVTTDAGGLLMARFFAASLIQLGLVLLLLREVQDSSTQRAVALGSAVGSLAGLAVAVLGQVGHIVNALGWSSVAIYGLLLLGYARYAFGGSSGK